MRFPRLSRLMMFCLTLALLAHLALLGLLCLRWYGPPELAAALPDPEPVFAAMLTQVEQHPDQSSPTVDDRELAVRIEDNSRRLQSLPAEQNLKTLRQNAAWLERYSSQQAVDEISSVVRRATGAPQRAYAPVAPPPPGDFDMKSMLPYSSERIVGKDGVERKEQVWVDKDGRTFKQTFRDGVNKQGQPIVFHGIYLPSGELFETETTQDTSVPVLDSLTDSPLLQRLFREGFLPVLESRRGKDFGQAPAAGGSAGGSVTGSR